MKYCILNFFVFFYSIYSFGQEVKDYAFDYYTLYNFKSENEEIILKRYVVGNSKDDSYFLYLDVTASDTINAMSLYDTSNNKRYEFNIVKKTIKGLFNFSDLTTSYTIYKYDFARKIDKSKHFEIEYDSINKEELITVKVFRGKRKKKLHTKVQYYMIKSNLVTNQFYITDIVFALKFPMREIATKGVLNRRVLFNKDSENVKETRELIEINPLELTLKLKTEPVITRTSLIIQYN